MKNWYKQIERICDNSQFEHIDTETNEAIEDDDRGTVIDGYTASMLKQIADALDVVNREKFTAMPIAQAVNVGWKITAMASKN